METSDQSSPPGPLLNIENKEIKEEEEDLKPAAKEGSNSRPVQLANKSSHEDTRFPTASLRSRDTRASAETVPARRKLPDPTRNTSSDGSECAKYNFNHQIEESNTRRNAKPEAVLSVHKDLASYSRSNPSSSLLNAEVFAQLPEKKMSANRPKSPKAQRAISSRKRRAPKDGQSTGRWTEPEHQAFLVGLATHGREWKKVAADIPTRTSAQVRSHAQKYFAKLQREEEENIEKARTESVLLPPSVQSNVDRILSNPEQVQVEVQHTMERLKRRYQQLQRRLQRAEHRASQDDNRSAASNSTISSLQNEELIALSVLHGSLPRSGSDLDLQKRQRLD